ncbi:SMC family ATPase [Desemzia sp. RIT804]|uniref:AAA family ATPase n=1 Tax=Desemzia sp. RIT 804 TaxID=2810209 RepID=UPI00194E8065|nr:SMC family ATPase [Desemzia sp. RIT 804]MBM6613914.1 SMC family ATPase [Desemzia sp. RIT 804]
MRPHSLTLKAFGPYMDETIDFSNFYGNNIFLIAGKTGSGKTTLFDGICFALFGKTNGSNREPKEMRSTFANSKETTSVTFTFHAQNKRYEIVRSPAQTLLKLKGEGTREVPAKASIRVFNEEGTELQQVTKISEVDALIEEVVQLTCDQFRQIVMIPQGEFRRFLNADSGDKENILRKLFGTGIYRQFSEKLKDKKKEMHVKLLEKEKELEATLSRAHWLEAKPVSDLTGFAGMKEELEKLKEDQSDMLNFLAALEAALTDLTNKITQANEFLTEQQTIQQLLTEKEELIAALEQLKKEQTHINELHQAINLCEETKPFEPLLFKLKENQQTLSMFKQKQLDTSSQLQTVQEDLKNSAQKKEQVEKDKIHQEQRKEQLIKLAHLKQSIEAYIISEKQNRQQEAVVKDIQTELKQFTVEHEGLVKEKNNLNQVLDELKDKKNQFYLLKDKLQEFEKAQSFLQETIQLDTQKNQVTTDLAHKTGRKDVVAAKLEEANKQYKEVKSDWAKIQIQKLSEDLIEGEPCPVCGSTEHPLHSVNKEKPKQTAVELEIRLEEKEKQIAAYQAEAELLHQQIDQLKMTEQRFTEELILKNHYWSEQAAPLQLKKDNLQKQTAELTGQINELKEQIEIIDAQLTSQTSQEEKKALIEKELAEVQKKLTLGETELQLEWNRWSELKGQLNQLSQDIPKEYLDTEHYRTEVQIITKAINEWDEHYEEVIQTHIEAEKTKEQVSYTLHSITETITLEQEKQQALTEQLTEALERSSFTTLEEVEKHVENNSFVTEWRNEINHFEKTYYNVQHNLELNMQKLDGKPLPELQEAQVQYDQLVKQKTQKAEEKAVLQDHFHQNKNVLKTCQSILDAHQKNMDLYLEIAKLSDVANGDTGNSKLGFERYVLSYFLEEVLVLANQRLQRLSNNRYLFDLNREDGSYKNRTGLEINIYDDHAGGIRNVGTLSGGESFTAALSLALSLSDVVQRQSGGVQIEAIFIDEGFGSLDEDALDQAIEALMQIDGDGKLVGIISHVKELKDRIPDKILVHALGTGKSQLSAVHA